MAKISAADQARSKRFLQLGKDMPRRRICVVVIKKGKNRLFVGKSGKQFFLTKDWRIAHRFWEEDAQKVLRYMLTEQNLERYAKRSFVH